ncbi:uncharacterized protein DNG_03994 [Cephalotrichum gorgonifer]|uniref:HNH nuclease domain-containing protein n=1 Tax=Cephalotrichum gorgonifer TaxID=2041049 RepID=A0AAE8SUS4_9PEZI|nr:uncharacterized protein DNG_03994 [Cephalotrichum gorgonifer]
MKRRTYISDAFRTVLLGLWGREYHRRLHTLILDDPGAINSARNMICLTPTLHDWWGKGYFALEPYEELPDGVRVRLRWLRRSRIGVYDKLPALATDPRTQPPPPQVQGVIAMKDLRSGHPLLDGALFDIVSDNPGARVSWVLLQLQWDLLKMATLCGAAEAAEDPDWNPDEDIYDEVEAGLQG